MEHRRTEVRQRLNSVFQEVFDDEAVEIFDEMVASDLEEWDSVMHISLVMAIEKAFDIELNAADIGRLNNIGAMVDLLAGRAV